MPGLRHRCGQVFALLGLAIVLPVWVAVSLADRVHRRLARLRLLDLRLPRPRHPRDALIIGLGALAIAIWSMGVAVMGIGPPTLACLLVFAPPALLAFALRRSDPVPEYLAGLVEDWLSRDGWKGQVVGIGPPLPNEDSPFRFAERVRVYRVFLEDESGEERFGWFRLGNGRIDFDWDENPPGELMIARPNRRREPAISAAPSSPEALTGRDPLWDPWLDG
jgi:hypothetical protein